MKRSATTLNTNVPLQIRSQTHMSDKTHVYSRVLTEP